MHTKSILNAANNRAASWTIGSKRNANSKAGRCRVRRRARADVPLENLEMSERKGIIFPLQFMGNAIPPTEPRGSNSWGPSLMPVNTIGLMQASQRSRDRTQIAKGQSER